MTSTREGFPCAHDKEWIQHQQFQHSDWECVGCGMRMTEAEMFLYKNQLKIMRMIVAIKND